MRSPERYAALSSTSETSGDDAPERPETTPGCDDDGSCVGRGLSARGRLRDREVRAGTRRAKDDARAPVLVEPHDLARHRPAVRQLHAHVEPRYRRAVGRREAAHGEACGLAEVDDGRIGLDGQGDRRRGNGHARGRGRAVAGGVRAHAVGRTEAVGRRLDGDARAARPVGRQRDRLHERRAPALRALGLAWRDDVRRAHDLDGHPNISRAAAAGPRRRDRQPEVAARFARAAGRDRQRHVGRRVHVHRRTADRAAGIGEHRIVARGGARRDSEVGGERARGV